LVVVDFRCFSVFVFLILVVVDFRCFSVFVFLILVVVIFFRYLVKAYQQAQNKQPQEGISIAYLQETPKARSTIQRKLTVEALVDAYKHRAFRCPYVEFN